VSDEIMSITIRIKGHLGFDWSDWFAGLDMRHLADGNTELYGLVMDQAALYGLLNRARDLNLTLLSTVIKPAGLGPDTEI
jgi:hypothetical protein